MPVPGSITGRVTLQGRTTYGGVTVSAGGTSSITTAADGSYWLADVPPAMYTVILDMPGYLQYSLQVAVSPGASTSLPDLALRAGDVNGDCTVGLMDLVMIAINYQPQPAHDGKRGCQWRRECGPLRPDPGLFGEHRAHVYGALEVGHERQYRMNCSGDRPMTHPLRQSGTAGLALNWLLLLALATGVFFRRQRPAADERHHR